jgi:effector-binding domain-containing protein
VEVGFPVASPIEGKDEIIAKTIPSQKIISTIDLGPYEKQDKTLEEIFTWIQENGCEMQGETYYQYLNDTERPASKFLTK